MRELLTIVAVVLTIVSPAIYVRSIYRGESVPHRNTRFVLLIITFLFTAALFSSGDYTAAWFSLSFAVECIVVFVISIRRGTGGWAPIDIACLITAAAGIVTWQLTDDPTWALCFAIGADFAGMVPTLTKTWARPDTEGFGFYAVSSVAAILIIAATPTFTFTALTFPIYILIMDLTMTWLALRSVPPVESRRDFEDSAVRSLIGCGQSDDKGEIA